jgi:hypothetical protein
VPSTDLDLRFGLAERLVIKVGLILETEGIRWEIKPFGPSRAAPQSQGACKD